MHYIEQGRGEPILFLHGNPTWSYLWRNVIPHVSPLGRCIAPDLIGMGRSDKPDIDYRFVKHAEYVEGFIAALGLRNITLVIHDWGSALGFDHSFRHEGSVRAIAFMEAIIRPSTWREQTLITRWMFRRFRHAVKGRRMIIDRNFFVERMLPMMAGRRLSEEEMEYYRAPYKDPASRKPLFIWPNQIPFDGDPPDTHERIAGYAAEARKVTVFLHPPQVPIGADRQMDQYKLEESVGRPFDTAMSAARLILSGVLDRYPNLKLHLAHMGGGLPMVISRIDMGQRLGYDGLPERAMAKCQLQPSEYLRRNFWADCMGFSAPGVRHMLEVFGVDRILLGTDYGPVPISPIEHIEMVESLALSEEDKAKILWKNAVRLYDLQLAATLSGKPVQK